MIDKFDLLGKILIIILFILLSLCIYVVVDHFVDVKFSSYCYEMCFEREIPVFFCADFCDDFKLEDNTIRDLMSCGQELSK